MNQEMSDTAGKAIIAGVVVAVLVAGYMFIKRSDPASQPFGVAPPGQIQKAMEEARIKGAQQRPTGAPPGASGTTPSPSASGSPPPQKQPQLLNDNMSKNNIR